MTAADIHEELSSRLFASLRRTGVNFIFVWFLALGGVFALSFTRPPWLVWSLVVVLALLFLVVCLPNIGRVFALHKMHGGLDRALRRQIVIADAGAVGTGYAIVALPHTLRLSMALSCRNCHLEAECI